MFDLEQYENQDFSYKKMVEEKLEKIRFISCDFNCADFSEILAIENCVFDSCKFASAELKGLIIKNSAFLNCRFKYANLFSTVFDNCKMTGSSFLDADISAASIEGGDWSYTDLRYASFSRREFKQIKFEGAELSESKFVRCRIVDCDFTKAITRKMSLQDSDIRGSIIDGIDFLSINMKGTKLDLGQCVLIAEATGAKYKP